MKKITAIEKKRFEIREPIRSFLATVKNYFGYDACALYLISVEETMHKNEKVEEFKKRFSDGKLSIEYSDKIENKKDCKENKDSTLQKAELKFNGKKKQNIREGVKGDEKEYEEVSIKLFNVNIKDKNSVCDHESNYEIPHNINDTPYKILKFIGVDDSYISNNENKQHWTYDYEKRPNKYIVFDDSFFKHMPEIANKNILYIENEGITAMVARCNIIIYMNSDQIYKTIGPKVRLSKDDTEIGIHPKCSELLAIPIYNDSNEIMGVIRLDNYVAKKRNDKYCEIKALMDKNDPDDIVIKDKEELFGVIKRLCLQVIMVSKSITKNDSYEKLFQGKTIIDAITQIEDTVLRCDIKGNNSIYKLTKHLFFVFQRHTYVGYEDIMMRTMFYIKDVFKSVDMEKYYDLTEKKLFDFMDHEKLMLYSTEKYRDHFMHQFHVFVMGYIIINAIGIGNITTIINNRLKYTEEYQNIEIDDESVLRIWVLISLFHDIAYIFQQYDKTMQKFISDNLLADIPVHIDWGIILSSNKNRVSYIETISELTKFFTSPNKLNQTNKTELLKNYIQAIEDNQDHGVFGAILLINLFMKIIKDNYIGNHKTTSKRIVEIYLAALAISMHNSCTYKSLKESVNIGHISFDSFPLEFLLMYCDTAQEWGRKKEVDKVFYDAPVLKSIKFDFNNPDNNVNERLGDYGISKIICELKYEGLNHPNEEKLNSFFLEKLSKFRSGNIKFGIKYEYETSKDRITEYYFSCNNDKNFKDKESSNKI